MGYRITTYAALQANLSAAGTTVGLCRASIGRLLLSDKERAETIERLRKQMGELDAMILELNRPEGKQGIPFVWTRRRKTPAPRRDEVLSDSAP